MLEALLTLLVSYGAPALGLIELVIALGLPLPGSFLLVAAGAFAHQGFLDPLAAATLAWLGAAVGDNLGYVAGRYARGSLQNRLEARPSFGRARQLFRRHGIWALLLTRTLLTSITLPVNLVAGASRMPYQRYLGYETGGTLLWVAVYGGLGYLFANSWQAVGKFLGNLSGLALGGLLIAAGIYLWTRRRKGALRRREKQRSQKPPAG